MQVVPDTLKVRQYPYPEQPWHGLPMFPPPQPANDNFHASKEPSQLWTALRGFVALREMEQAAKRWTKLGAPGRVASALARCGCLTADDLAHVTARHLQGVRGVGEVTLRKAGQFVLAQRTKRWTVAPQAFPALPSVAPNALHCPHEEIHRDHRT